MWIAHRARFPFLPVWVGLAMAMVACESGCGASSEPTAREPTTREPTAWEASAEPSASRRSPVTWSEPLEVATGPARAGPWRMNESRFHYVDDATVAFHDDGSVAVAWADNRRQDIYLRTYGPEGDPWSGPVKVSRSPDVFSWLPRMEVEGDRVYVLWQEIVFSGGSHGGEAFLARSTDGGKTFEPPTNLSETQAGCGKGRLTAERWDNGSLDLALGPDGTVFAAWTEYEGPLRLSRSTDHGATFSEPTRVAGTDDQPARGPSLAVAEDGTLYVAWTVGEDDEADIRLARSDDGGRSFEPLGVVDKTGGHSDAPKIAVDDEGTLHLVHAESPSGRSGRYHIRYSRLDESGNPEREPRLVSGERSGRRGAHFPMLALDGEGRLYVAWEHSPHYRKRPQGLALSLSTDGGRTFTAPILVPGTGRRQPGVNGSRQGQLARKLDAGADGALALVNSLFDRGKTSRVLLVRGTFQPE